MDWEIDDDRNRRGYVIGPVQAEYILQGETGTYSRKQRAEIPEKISAKAEKLPSRVQNLIDDIYLFHLSGDLEGITRNQEEKYNLRTLYPLFNVEQRLEQPEAGLLGELNVYSKFGLKLGTLLRLILSDNGIEEKHSDLIFGMILSEIRAQAESVREEEQILEELFDRFEEEHENYKKTSGPPQQFVEERKEIQEKIEPTSRRVLEEAGIKPTENRVACLAKLHTQTDRISESRPRSESEFHTRLSHIFTRNENKFRLVCHMEKAVLDDVPAIADASPRGIPAKKLLGILFGVEYHSHRDESWTNYDVITDGLSGMDTFTFPVPISQLNERMDRAQKNITTALNHLSNSYDRRGINWPNYKIVREEDSGSWELTGYGKVLTIILFDSMQETRWIYEHSFKNHGHELTSIVHECRGEITIESFDVEPQDLVIKSLNSLDLDLSSLE